MRHCTLLFFLERTMRSTYPLLLYLEWLSKKLAREVLFRANNITTPVNRVLRLNLSCERSAFQGNIDDQDYREVIVSKSLLREKCFSGIVLEGHFTLKSSGSKSLLREKCFSGALRELLSSSTVTMV